MPLGPLVTDTVPIGGKPVVVEKRDLSVAQDGSRVIFIALDELVVNDQDGNLQRVADVDGQRLPVDSPTLFGALQGMLAALEGVLLASDATPLDKSGVGLELHLDAGEHLSVLPAGGRTKVQFQWEADTDVNGDPLKGSSVKFNVNGKGYGLKYFDTGQTDPWYNAEQVDVTVEVGGTLRAQVWTV